MTDKEKAELYKHDLGIYQEENAELKLEGLRLKKENRELRSRLKKQTDELRRIIYETP